MEFSKWRAHIDEVVAAEDQWVGLADEFGWPILDLAAPSDASVARLRLGESDLEVTVPWHPRLDHELVGLDSGDRIGDLGVIRPHTGKTRLLVVQRREGRFAGVITHCVVTGAGQPREVTIHAADLVEGLAFWPGMSAPVTWQESHFDQWSTDASGQVYAQPRRLAYMEMTEVADGFTLEGRSQHVIRTFIQDSFDAVNSMFGFTTPHAVVDFSGPDRSPHRILRTTDDYVWDTVSGPASEDGVSITVRLWWPGDDGFVWRVSRDPFDMEGMSFTHPVQLVRVEYRKEE